MNPNPAYALRTALASDLDALTELEQRAFTLSDGPLTRRAFAYHLRSKNLLLVVLDHGQPQRLAGYILVFMHRCSARIYSLAVSSEHQGRGVAKTLVKAACAEAVARDLDCVNLEVRPSNDAAIGLYESIGFQKKSLRKNYYGLNENGWRMQWRVKNTA